MVSRDFYRILYGWDTHDYLTHGIRYCAIFIKNTESLSDDLLVQYTDGSKARRPGRVLFTDKTLALAYVEEIKQREIAALNFKIKELEAQREAVYKKFIDMPPLEEAAPIST
jgi:uncharacterized small protein (DUF1192 family)